MNGPEVILAPDWGFHLLPKFMKEQHLASIGILHVGAHHGQETSTYLECGFARVGLVEPDPINSLTITMQPWYNDPAVKLFPYACSSTTGMQRFYRTNGGVWSGLKQNPDHAPIQHFSVPTVNVREIQSNFRVNVLVVDTQGTEMDALRSADLTYLDLVVVETQADGKDGAHPTELASFAEHHGWEPVQVWDRTSGWTDTLLMQKGMYG